MNPVVAKSARSYQAFRISAGDSNRLALIFDPGEDGANLVACIEIFDVGGRTPPNRHEVGQEYFFVLKGEGVATCDGASVTLSTGDSMMVRPGAEHALVNTGPGRLYCLTVMTPDDGFTTLIRSGVPAALDEEDMAVLGRVHG